MAHIRPCKRALIHSNNPKIYSREPCPIGLYQGYLNYDAARGKEKRFVFKSI